MKLLALATLSATAITSVYGNELTKQPGSAALPKTSEALSTGSTNSRTLKSASVGDSKHSEEDLKRMALSIAREARSRRRRNLELTKNVSSRRKLLQESDGKVTAEFIIEGPAGDHRTFTGPEGPGVEHPLVVVGVGAGASAGDAPMAADAPGPAYPGDAPTQYNSDEGPESEYGSVPEMEGPEMEGPEMEGPEMEGPEMEMYPPAPMPGMAEGPMMAEGPKHERPVEGPGYGGGKQTPMEAPSSGGMPSEAPMMMTEGPVPAPTPVIFVPSPVLEVPSAAPATVPTEGPMSAMTPPTMEAPMTTPMTAPVPAPAPEQDTPLPPQYLEVTVRVPVTMTVPRVALANANARSELLLKIRQRWAKAVGVSVTMVDIDSCTYDGVDCAAVTDGRRLARRVLQTNSLQVEMATKLQGAQQSVIETRVATFQQTVTDGTAINTAFSAPIVLESVNTVITTPVEVKAADLTTGTVVEVNNGAPAPPPGTSSASGLAVSVSLVFGSALALFSVLY